MKRFLSMAALLLPLSLFGAAGDITGVNVEANGWVLAMTFEGATNGTFAFGFGANNAISGNEKIKLVVTSAGYNTDLSATTRARNIYALRQLRLPYPQAAVNDVVTNASAGTCSIRLVLSDYIYSGDTATFSIGSGFYTAQSQANNAAAGTVTINSTVTYAMAKCVGNWSWVDRQRVTGDFPLRCVVYQRDGMNGQPVRAVVFTASDAHSHSVSVTNTAMTLDHTLGDAAPVQEFVSTIPTSTFTDNDLLTCNFAAYPWVGDSGAVLDTSAFSYAAVSPYPHPLNFFFDKYGTNMWYAVVSTTNAGSGYITNEWHDGGPPIAFSTIAAASAALVKTTQEGTMYLRYGTHFITDDNTATLPKTWTIVTPFPGLGQGGVIITNGTAGALFCNFGNGANFGRIKFDGLSISDGGKSTWFGTSNLWLNNCILDCTAKSPNATWDGVGAWWITDCVVSNIGQGFCQVGSEKTIVPMIRGNTFYSNSGAWHPYTVLGNKTQTTNGFNTTLIGDALSGLPQLADWTIVANNNFLKARTDTQTLISLYNASATCSNGCAIVGNLIERVDTNQTPCCMILSGDSSTGNSTNVIVWNNSFVGKNNIAYNDKGTSASYRVLWSMQGNIWEDFNIKSDTFTGNPAASGNRIGNWPLLFGCGVRGDWFGEETGVGAAGSFCMEGIGRDCFQPSATGSPAGCTPTALNYIGWISFRSGINNDTTQAAALADGSAGNGNYRLATSSPSQGLAVPWLTPFDLEGNTRGCADPPGAYSSASPKKGAGFFAQ